MADIIHNLSVGGTSRPLGTVHYIEGTGTTAGTWLGSDPSISAYHDGLVIAYKLNIAGASTTTLNLNGLGAKTVYRGGTTKLTTQYAVDSVVLLVYTTTSSTGCWQVADYDTNTTYTPQKLGFGYGTCSTAAGTAAKAVTLADYTLVKNGFVAVKFTNAVTSSSSTMNINSKGAKAIYYNGAAIGTNVILAGDVCLFVYDGTYYHLLTIDRAFNGAEGIIVDNATIKHSNSVTAGTAQGDATKTLSFGGTFTIPTVTYDAQGHITAKGTTTMTMPANPNTDTKNTAGSSDTSSKIFLVGATSQASSATTYSHDTAYVGTDGCLYSGGTKVLTEHQAVVNSAPTLAWNTTSTVGTIGGTALTVKLPANPNTDTKNTAGSSNTDSKIFLIGSTSQVSSGTTYSHDTAYVGTDGHLYSNSSKVFSTSYAPEAYLQWGGKNFAGSWGPIDAAMVPNFAANRFAFLPASAITLEYSTNGGSTWTAKNDDATKKNLFSTGGSFYIGNNSSTGIDKKNYKCRITITTTGVVYSNLNKFAIRISTNGSTGCHVKLESRTKANQDAGNNTWVTDVARAELSGWSGWNIINVPGITTHGNASSQYSQLRFTFGVDAHASTSQYQGMQVLHIMAFGGEGWTTCSNMAKDGHLYSYDGSQNATFPAGLNTVGNLTENGTRVSKVGHTHTIGTESKTSGGPSATVNVASTSHTHTVDSSGSYTPAGSVSQPTFSGTAVTSDGASATTTIYQITGVGSSPSLSAAIANNCMTFTWSAGSVPTRSSVVVAQAHTHSVTAAGTVSKPTFSGTAATISVSGTTAASTASTTVASSTHTHNTTVPKTTTNASTN